MAATATLVGRMAWDDSAMTRGLKSSEGKIRNFASSVKGAVAAVAGLAVIGKATSFLKASIDAYLTEEAAIKKFEGALRSSGNEVEGNTSAMKALASEMQRMTVMEDDVVIGMGQMAISMGVTTQNMEKTIRGAIGLSRAFGINETTALKMAAGAMQGKFTTLGRYVPALAKATTEADKMAIAQRAMADAFGIATAEAESGAGKLTQLRNEFGDMKEQVGERVAPAYIEAMTGMRDATLGFAEVALRSFYGVGSALDALRTSLAGLIGLAGTAGSFLPGDAGASSAQMARGALEAAEEFDARMKDRKSKAIDPFLMLRGHDVDKTGLGFGKDARTGAAALSAPSKISAPVLAQNPTTFFGSQKRGNGGFATPSALDEMNGTLKSIDRSMKMQSSLTWK